jgi:TLD
MLALLSCQHTACAFVPASPVRQETTRLYFFSWGNKPEKPADKPAEPKPTETKPTETTEAYSSDDPVEKMFSFFFGKPEAEPMGLKRFGQERFPEQYPATVDDFDVAPVATDDASMAMLRPLLKKTNLEQRGLQLTYTASKQGWDPYRFHSAVDKKGGALVVCTTQSGLICGGYNPKGWVGYGEARGSIAAFLFRQNAPGSKYPFTKLRKVGGPGLAQM